MTIEPAVAHIGRAGPRVGRQSDPPKTMKSDRQSPSKVTGCSLGGVGAELCRRFNDADVRAIDGFRYIVTTWTSVGEPQMLNLDTDLAH